MSFFRSALAVSLAIPVWGSDGARHTPEVLTVHEWGTFTSVAAESGGPQPWAPLAGPSDLPCFVAHLHGKNYKFVTPPTTLPTTEMVSVRMETPVLYFYAPRKTTVSVHVDFPQGLITEWYPGASKVAPEPELTLPKVAGGRIEWNSVEITPGEKPDFPTGNGASHYYAAREADSDPIRIGTQREKLIFYRGVANFDVPLRITQVDGGKVNLHNVGESSLALAILFENRDGKIGYRVARGVSAPIQLDSPQLTASVEDIKSELASNLVEMGLFPKEADAMIATWSDSWFEEGKRVFYLVPRQMVDRVLPLSITPTPGALNRVFVGRVELLSPFMRAKLTGALSAGDTKTLDRFGRFLQPFLTQTRATLASASEAYLAVKAAAAQSEFVSPSCVQ